MSTRQRDSDGSRISIRTLEFHDFDVAWAGGSPWTTAYCLGSEDGRIRFVHPNGMSIPGIYEVSPSGESVNGIAFSDDLMAVSTRADVTFLSVPRSGEGKVERAVFHGGAFDVVAMPRGGFLAPLGRNGILVLGKKQGVVQNVRTIKAGTEGFNFYKVAPLAWGPNGEVIACAARKDGFAILTLGKVGVPIGGRRLRSPGVDFIDTCSMRSEQHPFAAVALGLDGSIHLTHDALNDPSPKTLRYEEIRGRAYRIFRHQGHLLLLTSEGLYTFREMSERFLAGDRIDRPTETRWLNFEAVEAEMAPDGHLFVVMPECVYVIDLDTVTAGGGAWEAGTGTGMDTSGGRSMALLAAEVREEAWVGFEDHAWVESKELELAGVL